MRVSLCVVEQQGNQVDAWIRNIPQTRSPPSFLCMHTHTCTHAHTRTLCVHLGAGGPMAATAPLPAAAPAPVAGPRLYDGRVHVPLQIIHDHYSDVGEAHGPALPCLISLWHCLTSSSIATLHPSSVAVLHLSLALSDLIQHRHTSSVQRRRASSLSGIV